MKKQMLYSIAMSVLFIFIVGLPAIAQSHNHLMTIQVPFDFQVNNKVLPAGKYVIRRDSQSPQLLLIQCHEKNIRMAIQTIPHNLPEYPAQSSLVFTEYGEKHFLSEVKVSGRGNGYALPKSKAERRLVQMAKEKSLFPTRAGDSMNK